MNSKETKSRSKINNLLEEADWRFFDNEFGENFDKNKNGFIHSNQGFISIFKQKIKDKIAKVWGE